MRHIRLLLLYIICFSWLHAAEAQTIGSHLPDPIKHAQRYLFYLHGGVVTVLGDNAINQGAPEWGPYQYSSILDTLQSRGFNVVSEIRKQSVADSLYVQKLVAQIDTLLRAGVRPANIVVVGASAGKDIMLHAAHKLKKKNLRYVMMGGCWPDAYKQYTTLVLYGRYLSIIEATDPHGTCKNLFATRKTITRYKEITLNTGLSHGFLYKGHRAWVDPVVTWATTNH